MKHTVLWSIASALDDVAGRTNELALGKRRLDWIFVVEVLLFSYKQNEKMKKKHNYLYYVSTKCTKHAKNCFPNLFSVMKGKQSGKSMQATKN